jgi:predicted nucleic acid-binding protein
MRAGPVVSNNTALVALWVLGRLDLLPRVYGEVLIPQAVYDEFLATERGLRLAALEHAAGIRSVSLATPQRARIYVGLDQGEAEVLALAEECDARLVIIDELKGRRYAQRLGLPLTGTLGFLLLAKEKGLIGSMASMIAELQNSGLHLDLALVAEVLRLAGEAE